MGLKDLKEREAVLRALQTYDRPGRSAFLKKFGFAPADEYVLSHEGRYYDSKPSRESPIFFQTDELLPPILSGGLSNDFSDFSGSLGLRRSGRGIVDRLGLACSTFRACFPCSSRRRATRG